MFDVRRYPGQSRGSRPTKSGLVLAHMFYQKSLQGYLGLVKPIVSGFSPSPMPSPRGEGVTEGPTPIASAEWEA